MISIPPNMNMYMIGATRSIEKSKNKHIALQRRGSAAPRPTNLVCLLYTSRECRETGVVKQARSAIYRKEEDVEGIARKFKKRNIRYGKILEIKAAFYKL